MCTPTEAHVYTETQSKARLTLRGAHAQEVAHVHTETRVRTHSITTLCVRSQMPARMCAPGGSQRCTQLRHKQVCNAHKCTCIPALALTHRHAFSHGPRTCTRTHKPTQTCSHSAGAQACMRIHTLTYMGPCTLTSYSTRRANCLLPRSGTQTQPACGQPLPLSLCTPVNPLHVSRDEVCLPPGSFSVEPGQLRCGGGRRCPKPRKHSERHKTNRSTAFPHDLSNTP